MGAALSHRLRLAVGVAAAQPSPLRFACGLVVLRSSPLRSTFGSMVVLVLWLRSQVIRGVSVPTKRSTPLASLTGHANRCALVVPVS